MKNIVKKYEKKYGYKPSTRELYSLYTSGCLVLSDREEDELLRLFEKEGFR